MKFKASDKVYAHIDCNSFFASCEIFRNPSLKGKCVCVGNEIIVAASYEAKKFGIKTGTPVWEARRILGNRFILIHPDLQFYKKISQRFTSFIEGYSNSMEVFSIDEAFIDITGMAEYHGMDYLQFAVFLKKEVFKCIGIPVSIGISTTRIRAKIFSDLNKPFGECIAFDDEDVSRIFSRLVITDTPFVGKKTGEKLRYISKTIEDFRRLSFWKVDEMLGKNGTDLWLELNGVDIMNFKGNPIPKSISRTASFNKIITNDRGFLWSQIIEHFNRAYFILTRYNLELRSVGVYLRDKDFGSHVFEYRFGEYTNLRSELFAKIRELFNEAPDITCRSTGILFGEFKEVVPKQLSVYDLDNKKFDKNKKLVSAIEGINKRFSGKIVNIGSINPGSTGGLLQYHR